MAAPDTPSSSQPDARTAETPCSLPRLVVPSTWRGWSLLVIFLLLVVMGIWPVIGWINQQTLLWGMPSLIIWSYLIIFACSGAMLLGNCLLRRRHGADPLSKASAGERDGGTA